MTKQQQNLEKDKSLKELYLIKEKVEREYKELLDEVGVQPDQIKAYLDNPENFTRPIWEQLQAERKRLSEKLDLSEKNIRNPAELRKTFFERGTVQPHWLFVR